MDSALLQQHQHNQQQLFSNHGPSSSINQNPLHYPQQQQKLYSSNPQALNRTKPSPHEYNAIQQPVAVHPFVSLHRPSRSVIHVKENSMDELDALFDPTKWSNRKSNQLPLIKRNLPQSFFRPPETGGTKTPKRLGGSTNHSRQGSVDMTSLQSNSVMLNQQHLLLQKKLNNLNNNHHSRSASEPVSVMPPFLMKQHHNGLGLQNQPPATTGPHHLMHQSSLPHGWQSANAPNGQQYYINYATQETSWALPTGPALSQSVHAPSPLLTINQNSILGNVSLSLFDKQNKHAHKDLQLSSLHSSAASSPLAGNSNYHLDQYSSTYSNNPVASSIGSVSEDELEINSLEKVESQEEYEYILSKIAMPEGWQKAQTDKGEIYFINHNTMSTQWEDPRLNLIPSYLKRQQQPKQYQTGQQLGTSQFQNSHQGALSNSVSPFDTVGFNSSVASSFSSSCSINDQALSSALGSMPIDDLNSLLNPLNPNQDDIKNLILHVISKKQDLFKTLEELNKQETYLRAQLNVALEQDHSSLNLSAEEFEIITNLESTITSGESTSNSGVLGDSNKSNVKVKDEISINDTSKLAELEQMSNLYNKMLINSNSSCTINGQPVNGNDGNKENSSNITKENNYFNNVENIDESNINNNNNNANNSTIIEDL